MNYKYQFGKSEKEMDRIMEDDKHFKWMSNQQQKGNVAIEYSDDDDYSTVRHRSIDSKENPLSAFKNLVDIKPTYKSKYLKDSFKIRSNDEHTLKKPLLASIDPMEAVTSKNKTLNSSINRNQTPQQEKKLTKNTGKLINNLRPKSRSSIGAPRLPSGLKLSTQNLINRGEIKIDDALSESDNGINLPQKSLGNSKNELGGQDSQRNFERWNTQNNGDGGLENDQEDFDIEEYNALGQKLI